MTVKTHSTSSLPSVLLFSSGNIPLLHKSLLGLSRIDVSGIYIIEDINMPTRELEPYRSVNDDFLTKNNVTFINSDIHEQPLTNLINLDKVSHVFFLREGDCIDQRSAQALMKSSQKKVITYPELYVTYSRPHSLNRIYETPSFPDTIEQARLATIVSPNLGRSFVVAVSNTLKNYILPSKKVAYSAFLRHIFIDLLAATHIAKRTPSTAIFSSANDYTALSSNPPALNTFNNLATLRKEKYEIPDTSTAPTTIKQKVKHILKDSPQFYFLGQKALHYTSIVRSTLPSFHTKQRNELNKLTDAWLIDAANDIHTYNAAVYLSYKPTLIFKKESNESISTREKLLRQCIQQLNHSTYDYVLIVPWLTSGGADMFFVNYANVTAELFPDKKVLVVSTEPSRPSLSHSDLHLSEKVDFLRLAEFVENTPNGRKEVSLVLPAVVELAGAHIIHVGLSDAGYKYVKKYKGLIKDAGRKIILTGYNEIVTHGKREGYVHDIIPEIFDIADIITTDNQKIINLWSNEYGLPEDKVLIHHQPFDIPTIKRDHAPIFSKERPARVLWAAHLRKEKNPITFRNIAEKLADNPLFTFTAYGAHDKAHYPLNPFTHPRQSRLSYRGGYKSFLNDVHPENFDIFVYTSLADGTPNVLIEAGMTELPIISSEVGGIPSLIKGDGSLIKNPEDTDAYLAQLEAFVQNPQPFYEKAGTFKNRLKKTQTISSFSQEVRVMLQKLHY